MASYQVTLESTNSDMKGFTNTTYVTAPDGKAGYEKARRKAEAQFAKQGNSDWKATDARCVG